MKYKHFLFLIHVSLACNMMNKKLYHYLEKGKHYFTLCPNLCDILYTDACSTATTMHVGVFFMNYELL